MEDQQERLPEKVEPSSSLNLLDRLRGKCSFSDVDLTEDEIHGVEPSEEDWNQLREVADVLPVSAYLVILIEFCERFTFYGLSGPFQNYVQAPDPGHCKLCGGRNIDNP
jgi:hypothetical protein